MKAFTIMGRILKGVYEDLFLLVFVSVAWWAGALLVVTGPFATAGLHNVTNRIANYRRADQSFFWEGAHQHKASSTGLYLAQLLFPILLFFSAGFYFSGGGMLLTLGVVLLWCLLFWAGMSQYFYPLLWQQTEPSVLLVLRNAAVLALRHPLYSLLMLLFQLAMVVLCLVLVAPIILLLPGVIALSQNLAMTGLLQEMGLAPQPPQISKN